MNSRNQRSYHRLAQKAPRPAPVEPAAASSGDAPAPITIGGGGAWRVLIAAPHPSVVADATYHLVNFGLRVATALTGPEVLTAVRLQRPDLIVLATDLPEIDGLEILRRLRVVPETRFVAVIALLPRETEGDVPSASVSANADPRVAALAAGADDCIQLPFEPRELVLRAGAILRRFIRLLPNVDEVLTLENLTLHVGSQEVTIDDELVDLTPREFLLLRLFLTHPARLFRRSELHDLLWSDRKPVSTRAIDMHVSRLRAKLRAARLHIETVQAEGYLLRPLRARWAAG